MGLFKSKPTARQRRVTAGRVAFNYYRTKPSPPPVKAARPAMRPLLGKLVARLSETLTLFILVGLLIYSLIVTPSPKIQVDSNLYHSTVEYQKTAASLMSGLKYHNKISFDESAVIDHLQAVYPEISNAELRLPLLGHRPALKLDIAEPRFKLVNDGRPYLVGEQGTVVAEVGDFKLPANLPVLDDRSGFQIKVGKPAFDSTAANFIRQLLDQLKSAKVNIKNMSLSSKPQELDLVATDHSYFVKFYLGGDSLTEVGQYLAARQHFNKAKHWPAQYLDVRVPGKIFYK